MQYGNDNESTAINATIQTKKVEEILSYRFPNKETEERIKNISERISGLGRFLAKPLGSRDEKDQTKADEALKEIDTELRRLLTNGEEELYGELMESKIGLEILYARHFHMSKEKAERYA